MKYKAILVNATLKGREWQMFTRTKGEAEQLAKGTLESLTDVERQKAYVKVVEITEVPVCEIHTAVEKGKDGELLFAIANAKG